MRYVIALFFPWITFFTMGMVGRGFLCLLLQMTIIGWLPATIWAMTSVGGYNADKRTDRIVEAMSKPSGGKPVPPMSSPIPQHKPGPRQADPVRPIPTVEAYFGSSPSNDSSRQPPTRAPIQHSRSPIDPSSREFDQRKWRALVRFDEEIATAARQARSLGAQWEDELARSYLRLNDKSYLDALLAKIAKEAGAQTAL